MIKRKRLLQSERQGKLAPRFGARLMCAVSLVLLSSAATLAIPASEYHVHVRQSVTALKAVAQSTAAESEAGYFARDAEAVRSVRSLLPRAETVEWKGVTFNVDNSWLHQDLDKYEADTQPTRYDLLKRLTERLTALDERLTETEELPTRAVDDKDSENRRLAEILQRAEYARKVPQQNALSRLLKKLYDWFKS